MFEFTVIEKHEVTLDEWMNENGFPELAGEVFSIDDYAPSELMDAFDDAVEDYMGCDLRWGEIESDDLYDICDSDEFAELIKKTSKAAEKLAFMDDGDTVAEMIEFFVQCNTYDLCSGSDIIDFYADTLDTLENDPSAILTTLKELREEADEENAETIDEYIESIEEK